jgi:hypothetical protein
MKRGTSHLVVMWVLFGLILQLCGGMAVWAANAAVHGRVTVEGGMLPQGARVKATPMDGGAPIVVPVAPDGTYKFAQLAEGAYLFEVTGPDGATLGSITPTLVPPGDLPLPLRVQLKPPAGPDAAVPPPPPGREPSGPVTIPPPSPPNPKWSAAKKWGVWGTVVGILGVGVVLDPGGSPSSP